MSIPDDVNNRNDDGISCVSLVDMFPKKRNEIFTKARPIETTFPGETARFTCKKYLEAIFHFFLNEKPSRVTETTNF